MEERRFGEWSAGTTEGEGNEGLEAGKGDGRGGGEGWEEAGCGMEGLNLLPMGKARCRIGCNWLSEIFC